MPFAIFVAVAFLLSGCARYASVAERRPAYRPSGALTPAQRSVAEGLRLGRKDALAAAGHFLSAAHAAAAELRRNPGNELARETYNLAVARIFTAMRDADRNPWSQPLRVPAPGGDYLLTYRPLKLKQWSPAQFEFIPADQFDVKGRYVSQRVTRRGLGAPLVAIAREKYAHAEANFVSEKIFYGVTATVSFEGAPGAQGLRRAVLQIDDPLTEETVRIAGRSYPLAADFTVPLAVMLAQENPQKLELMRLLAPEHFAKTAHILRLQPYDPKKTVVIVTHGLKDSPATWTPMLNQLRGDPFIRQHFQFWFYSYPSGYPYPYSAAIMRDQLDAIEARFPLRQAVVLIGHSMGSLISRLMITDTGEQLWREAFGKSPDETKLLPATRRRLEHSLIFRHRPEVGRAIFISGPHRGAEMATSIAGRIGAQLVRAPAHLVALNREVRGLLRLDTTALRLSRAPNSIDTLAPNNRFVRALNTMPITPGIPYHSIIGDRGRGGNKDHTPPVSSDGVVPYWSSHLEGAESELIVPSNHSAHQNALAIAEVQRILRLHAGRGPRHVERN